MADEWTLLENLLLVQAVYKYGEDSWLEIATKLSRHSLLKRNANFFNQQVNPPPHILMCEFI
jgi:bromodomain-containing protein 8